MKLTRIATEIILKSTLNLSLFVLIIPPNKPVAVSKTLLEKSDWLTPSELRNPPDESRYKACVCLTSLSFNLYWISDFNTLLTVGNSKLKSGSGLAKSPLTPIITSTGTFLLKEEFSPLKIH